MHNPNNKECKATCDSDCNQDHTHFDENDCTCRPEQKEEWEEELYNLAAINYNLYLSGTCERSDTGEDWTFDDARWEIRDFLRTQITLAEERGRMEVITENTSDGFHSFKELYEFRKIFNVILFNEWAKQGKYSVHKSIRHGDGELAFGGGWFIVMATLPTGQISNHYEMKDFDLFQCEEREKADMWDGHTAHDVLERLSTLTQKL